MKKFLVFAAFLIAGSIYAQSGEKNFIDQPYIEVNGTAEADIVPDMIYLKIIISELDTKGRVSVETQERKMKQQLADLGIDVAKDLSVGDFSSSYIKYFLKEKDVTTSRQYVLIVHDAAMAGKVIRALGDQEISNISVMKIDHSQMAQKRFDLRLEALKAAKRKAEAMAAALGQSIGKAIFITENNNEYYMPQTNSNIMVRGFGSLNNDGSIPNVDPDLSFRNINIKSSVSVKFILN